MVIRKLQLIEAILDRCYAKCLFSIKFATKFSAAEQILYFVNFIRSVLLQNTCERHDLFFGKYLETHLRNTVPMKNLVIQRGTSTALKTSANSGIPSEVFAAGFILFFS